MIGDLNKELTIEEFSRFVKKRLKAKFVKLWLADKNLNSVIKKIAICGGSGSSLLSKVYKRADIFVSSGFDYHTLLDSKIPLINAGHFYTEYPVLENMREMLSGFEVEIIELKAVEHEIQKEIII